MKFRLIHLVLAVAVMQSCVRKPEEKIDHIILAVADLEAGMRQFEEATGVRPVLGGVHPNSFTQNALVALNDTTYLEILAPRKDSVAIPDWILAYHNLTPVGWAVRSPHILNTRGKVLSLGFECSEPAAGSRARPDGSMLSWSSFAMDERRYSVLPFFIEWGENSLHPSLTSPGGCELNAIEIYSPDSGKIQKLMEALGLSLGVHPSTRDSITLQLKTPRGIVTFPLTGV